MLEMYFVLQLARSPLQALARRLMCQGLNLATHGRHQCPGQSSVNPDAD